MIKQLLNRLFNEKKIECSVDQDEVDCEHLDDDQEKAYTGVPAPVLNPIDEWFAAPYGCPSAVTEKQKEIESEAFKEEAHKYYQTKESPNIHQEMYDLATKNGKTTTQLDPVGGSETFQEGWQSGSGMV